LNLSVADLLATSGPWKIDSFIDKDEFKKQIDGVDPRLSQHQARAGHQQTTDPRRSRTGSRSNSEFLSKQVADDLWIYREKPESRSCKVRVVKSKATVVGPKVTESVFMNKLRSSAD
jgi:hypothetical protein